MPPQSPDLDGPNGSFALPLVSREPITHDLLEARPRRPPRSTAFTTDVASAVPRPELSTSSRDCSSRQASPTFGSAATFEQEQRPASLSRFWEPSCWCSYTSLTSVTVVIYFERAPPSAGVLRPVARERLADSQRWLLLRRGLHGCACELELVAVQEPSPEPALLDCDVDQACCARS